MKGSFDTSPRIASQAFIVIANLAQSADMVGDPEVIRALDYFSNLASGEKFDEAFLPWVIQQDGEK